jgi:16S rRNA C1402 N4-methylase RsmH
MAKRFEYYYLQLNTGPAWETAEQSDSVAALTTGLADHLASSTDAEIRVVGANFDEESESWAYEQLFYIDQSIIDLGISEELDEAGMLFSGTFKDAEPANLALREERHIPADDAYIEGATSDDMVNQEPSGIAKRSKRP